MARRVWRLRRPILATLFATLAALATVGATVAVLGLYNVAASTGHWQVVEALLRFGMSRSVKARAPRESEARPDDDHVVRLGAAHFELGCAYCHGSPIRTAGPVALAMLPPPPDLRDRVARWRDGELFWIVRHGIKYTGMPAWPVAARGDEVWTLVSFLRRLPALDRDEYRRLAFGGAGEGAPLSAPGNAAEAMIRCAACHGAGTVPPSRLVPVLQGQSADRLLVSLERYRSGERQSAIMQQAVSDLETAILRTLAEAYAAMPAPDRVPDTVDPGTVQRGAILAREGDPSRGVPACLACHSASALPLYPRLAGQPADFLRAQLHVFRQGGNSRGLGAIMTPIAKRLNAEDIAAAAAYFSAQSAGEAP